MLCMPLTYALVIGISIGIVHAPDTKNHKISSATTSTNLATSPSWSLVIGIGIGIVHYKTPSAMTSTYLATSPSWSLVIGIGICIVHYKTPSAMTSTNLATSPSWSEPRRWPNSCARRRGITREWPPEKTWKSCLRIYFRCWNAKSKHFTIIWLSLRDFLKNLFCQGEVWAS